MRLWVHLDSLRRWLPTEIWMWIILRSYLIIWIASQRRLSIKRRCLSKINNSKVLKLLKILTRPLCKKLQTKKSWETGLHSKTISPAASLKFLMTLLSQQIIILAPNWKSKLFRQMKKRSSCLTDSCLHLRTLILWTKIQSAITTLTPSLRCKKVRATI